MKKLRRIKYLIPTLVTCTGLYFACLAASVAKRPIEASWYVMICVLLDKLDGTTARLLKATTKVGIKLDSFVDSIAFGLVPGLIIFQAAPPSPVWAMHLFRIVGVIYIAGTVLRLRKFNRLAKSTNPPKCFYGIPSPLAAALLASYCVAFGPHFTNEEGLVSTQPVPGLIILPIIGLILAKLMNCNFPTLKVGIPKNKLLLLLQCAGFTYLSFAVFTQSYPLSLFVLGLVTLFISIFFGWKRFGHKEKQKI
jgi:CDP-diacylglycerol--serine O-phosphatidyltransferase